MSVRIDSHQHFWSVSDGKAMWPTPEEGKIFRDFGPADLEPHLARTKVSGTILVQVDPTEADTHELLELARSNEFVLGVVGWIDFEAADAQARIAKLAADPLVVGLRPMLQIIPDREWILKPALASAIQAMLDHQLCFDALVKPPHLSALFEFCLRYPQLPVVIDHAAKPNIRERHFDDWARRMSAFARETNVQCKISGLVTEAGSSDADAMKPYVDHLLQCFGPQRLMWGSDWPVCEGVCSYEAWYDVANGMLQSLSTSERDAVFGEVARDFYRPKRFARQAT